MELTVEIAAQQLQSQSRLLHKADRLNPDVASHNWWREGVWCHPGTVQVPTKSLKHNTFIQSKMNGKDASKHIKHDASPSFLQGVLNNSKFE